jgi:hypothetical protein
MTDDAIAAALVHVEGLEQTIRAAWERAAQKNAIEERDDVLKVLREAIALTRALERWMTARARRGAAVVVGRS